ncbi:hypothetical protein WKH21_14150 [Pantoea agglomerans]|uniref:hypothetical protein n=1 Tax=Enterobacter agglomerans TaxID=549 RepID=UPI003C7A7E2A
MLKENDIVYGGVPGQSGFYFDKATLDAAAGSRESLWKILQVLPHPKFGYRGHIQAYRVNVKQLLEPAKHCHRIR